MISIVHATRGSTALSDNGSPPADAAFDDAGVRIGTVTRSGVVTDDGGIAMGVVWPDGGVYDYTGRRIGRTWAV
jgi:hypothetical protein